MRFSPFFTALLSASTHDSGKSANNLFETRKNMKAIFTAISITIVCLPVLGNDLQFFKAMSDVPTRIENFTVSPSNISMNIVSDGIDTDACIESTFSLTNDWVLYEDQISLNLGTNNVALPKLEYDWQQMSGAFLSKQHGIWETTTQEKWIESAFGLGEAVLDSAIQKLLHAPKFLGHIGTLISIMDQIPSAGGSIVVKNDLELTANALYLEEDNSFVQEWYKTTVGTPLLPICVTSPKWSTDHEEINPETGEMDYVAEYTQTLEIKVLEYDAYFGYEVWHSYTNINLLNNTEAKFIIANYYLVPNETLSLPVGKYEIKWGAESKRVKIYPIDGLVAYYPFDGDAQDYSGNGNHGIEEGNAYEAGRVGQSARFYGGDSSHIRINQDWISSSDDEITVTAWVNIHSTTEAWILSQRQSDKRGDFGFVRDRNGKLMFYYHPVSGRPVWVGRTISSIPSGWAFIAAAYNVTSNQVTLYINQSLETSTMVADGSTTYHNAIGGVSTASYNQYDTDGNIDELRIYNRVLSLSEVQELYQQGQ